MSEPDVLILEIGAVISILGLLLVFMPLFLQRAQAWAALASSQSDKRARERLLWFPPALMAVAAIDASMGLLTLWCKVRLATETGWLLLVLIWATVILSVVAVKARD